MATAAVETRKLKCQFWDKCYRKSQQHRAEYLHPDETPQNDPATSQSATSQSATSQSATSQSATSQSATSQSATSQSATSQSRPRLVHEISAGDDAQEPAWKTSRKRKSTDDVSNGELNSSKDDPTPAAVTTTQNSNHSKTSDATSDNPLPPGPSPSKKLKRESSEEVTIVVDYSKTKKTAVPAAPASGSTATTETAMDRSKMVQYTGKKPKCKYWDKCYQTSEVHKNEFLHPDEDVPEETKTKKTRADDSIPLHTMTDDVPVLFKGDKDYVLKKSSDIFTCTCVGFVSQRAPINERSCKHLKEYLGADFEKARIVKNAKRKPVGVKSHIQLSLLLAHKYDDKLSDPVGWWISEKLDGVRAFWNGRCFYSRLGNAFYAPDWFTQNFPKDITLDGELFGGRGQFQSTVSIVKTAECPKWKDLRYHVFDCPSLEKKPFEERMNTIKEYLEEHQPEYVVFVEQTKCKSKAHLEEKLDRVLTLGGEGLMIRQPKSKYERTRSKTLLKIKKFYDAEAIVIGHEKGKNSNAFRCGALRCRMACGTEFSVGSGLTNANRNKPPKVGSIITYKFQELTDSGVPRFPTFVGVCIDKTEPKDADIRPVLTEEDL